jgi:formylglycine-generating enzyme required for sulfatase activity/uncharacterized caspase-like protein
MSTHVFCIGVNGFRDALIPSLLSCERDARDFSALLKEGFGYQAEYLEERMTEEIEQRLIDLGRRLRPGDLFILYFSGHGKAHADDHYLLLPGARLAAFASGALVASGVLSYRGLKHLTAGPGWHGVHRLFIIDACRDHLISGMKSTGSRPVFDGQYLLRDPGLRKKQKDPGDENLTVLNSCDLGSCAVELPALGHGVFTAALLAMMRKGRGSGQGVAIDKGFVVTLGIAMDDVAREGGLPADLRHQPVLSGEPLRLFPDREDFEDSDDETDWAIARAKGTLEALEAYVRRKPPGKHRAEALELIEKFRLGQGVDKPQPRPAWLKPVGMGVIGLVLLGGVGIKVMDGRKEDPSAVALAAASQPVETSQKDAAATTAAGAATAAIEAMAVSAPAPAKLLEETFKDGSGKAPAMVLIPAGSYTQGDKEEAYAQPRRVTIGQAFYLGRTEVTQGQWQAVMGSNPSGYNYCGVDCPVEHVSWHEAKEYVRKLNMKVAGREDGPYRLPSESEWEYACRGGKAGQVYCGGNDAGSAGWFRNNSEGKPHAVGQKPAGGNGLGLYDMSGNVWEWLEDCYVADYKGVPSDGRAFTDCGADVERVLSGGSWSSDPGILRAADRYRSSPGDRDGNDGFRLARTL